MRKRGLAIWLLLAGTSALAAQTGPQTQVRPDVRPATLVQSRVQINPTAVELDALRIAKARPKALQLRAAIAKLPQSRVNLVAIDRLNVPVLVSARPALLANLHVFTAAQHYTASARQNGITVEINGTRLPVLAPKNFRMPMVIPTVPLRHETNPHREGAPPAPSDVAADALRNVNVVRTSYGVDVSFTRFGAIYNMTIDCGAEGDDPEAIGPATGGHDSVAAPGECTKEKALELAKELEVAGGGDLQ